MIISRTPYRVSLFGGGSDYPTWYRSHGGRVIGFAINKFCYISVRHLPPFFEHRHRIVYSAIETVREVADIQHPAVRHVLQQMGIKSGLEIHHDGDLPARSGVGSSSSFTVGLLTALHALSGRMIGKQELARQAIHIEQNVIREHVGSQDQVWAAYGGFNEITFRQDGSFAVQPVIMTPERQAELIGSLLLCFTGVSRVASEVAERKIANLSRRQRHVEALVALADQAASLLGSPSGAVGDLGRLLHESWQLKRELAEGVTSHTIDQIYSEARMAGALGGKLLGAGGGGFMLLFVESSRRAAVSERLRRLIRVEFAIERSGSRVMVYEPDGSHES
jgi:D-glycero-alpha-D-manno-heptose-7-phosphate kinase